ncbi:MAG: hypothetical protein ACREX8_13220 [Gammaproteobacteria bacterium]
MSSAARGTDTQALLRLDPSGSDTLRVISSRQATPLLFVAVLLGLLEPRPAAGESSSAELLERYRPVLRYDRDERYHAQPVAPPFGAPRERRGDRAYGHLAREDGRRWLQ